MHAASRGMCAVEGRAVPLHCGRLERGRELRRALQPEKVGRAPVQSRRSRPPFSSRRLCLPVTPDPSLARPIHAGAKSLVPSSDSRPRGVGVSRGQPCAKRQIDEPTPVWVNKRIGRPP